MEEKNEEPMVFLDRTSRATRGKRMTKLLDDELEEDELFWNQDALKEEENDDQYEEEEAELADEFDSDFNDDESEPDNDAVNDVEERRPKKRLIFPGKPSAKKKKKIKKDLSEINKTQEGKLSDQPRLPQDLNAPDDTEAEKTIRKSTRTAVIVKQAERDAIRAALQAISKPIKRKKEGEEKRMSQEEMLLEAAQTEIMNLINLERVLAREEEVKKRAVVHKAVYTGPQIRYISKAGHNYLEFKGLSFESQIMTVSAPYPEKAICAVTGLPAKYRDPMTGIPYATKEAFRVIRERYSNVNSGNRKADMGSLSHAISGQGFGVKRKRSMASSHEEASFHKSDARFRKIPSVEYEVSD